MSTLNGATLTPAYGRDYSSAKAAIADFLAGKDFSLASLFHGSGYVSKADFEPRDRISIRFSRLRKVCTYTVTECGHYGKGGAA